MKNMIKMPNFPKMKIKIIKINKAKMTFQSKIIKASITLINNIAIKVHIKKIIKVRI